MIDDPDIRGNLLFPNPEMQELAAENEMIARQASEAEWKAFNEGTMQRMNALGRQIGKAADMLESRSIPEDMRNDGLMLLAGVMQEAKRKVEAGEIAVPAGENLYDYALSTDETLQSQVQQVLDLQKTVQEIQEQNAVEAALAREKQLEAAQARFQAGNATETDVALLAGREEAQSMDVNRGVETDALRMNYHMQLAGTISTYYADSGDYWKGESAAAAEAAGLRRRAATRPNSPR